MGFANKGLLAVFCVTTSDRVWTRLPALALGVNYCGAATCPEAGGKWEVTGSPPK
jgi:hypothetical protein